MAQPIYVVMEHDSEHDDHKVSKPTTAFTDEEEARKYAALVERMATDVSTDVIEVPAWHTAAEAAGL